MTRAAIYCRISHDPDGTEAGVERQEEDCRNLAARLGYEVVRVFIDNDTGASTLSKKTRPQYDEMFRGIAQGKFTAILAYSNSRLTRRPREWIDLIDLANKGLKIKTVVSGSHDLSTADGRATALTIAAWDAAEAERTGERARRAFVQMREKGQWRGGKVPFGYRKAKNTLTVFEPEAAQIRQAFEDVLAGRPLLAIVKEWGWDGDRRNVSSRSTALRNRLLSPTYAGLVHHKNEIVGEAQWPAIIDRETFDAVGAILRSPGRKTSFGPPVKILLSGIAKCGECGASMRGGKTASYRGQPPKRLYLCERYFHVSRVQEQVDDLVIEYVHQLLMNPSFIAALTAEQEPHPEAKIDRERANVLRARLAEFENDYAEGHITGAQFAKLSNQAQAELETINTRQAERLSSTGLLDLVETVDPVAAFDNATFDRKRTVIHALVSIRIDRAPTGRPKKEFQGIARGVVVEPK
jgi:DNA invertase Pin-like site-specific DNA recombinase